MTYYIELSYYSGKQLYFEQYRNIVADNFISAIQIAIDRFHKDRRPIIFDIHRIVIETEKPFKRIRE